MVSYSARNIYSKIRLKQGKNIEETLTFAAFPPLLTIYL